MEEPTEDEELLVEVLPEEPLLELLWEDVFPEEELWEVVFTADAVFMDTQKLTLFWAT